MGKEEGDSSTKKSDKTDAPLKKKRKRSKKMEVLPIPSKGALEAMLVSKADSGIPDETTANATQESDEAAVVDTQQDEKPSVKPLKKKQKKSAKPVISDPKLDNPEEKESEETVGPAKGENDDSEPTTNKHLLYLETWKNDRENWNFKKVCQVWLIKNLYKKESVDDKHFPMLLEYLDGLKGGARERLLASAKDKFNDKSSDSSVKERSREIIQRIA